MRADPGRHPARAAPTELLEEHRFIDDAGIGAAEFLVVFEAQQVQRGKALEQFAGELPLLFPLVDVRTDLLVDELADRPAKLFVLGAEEVGPGRGYVCQ